jgi:predicted transcriptional regulator
MAEQRGKLGDLEREVMEVFWSDAERARTVHDLGANFPNHAYTTLLTVVSRLVVKGFLNEQRVGRRNTFIATSSREAYVTALLVDVLNDTSDRRAALAHFAATLPASDRHFLARLVRRND